MAKEAMADSAEAAESPEMAAKEGPADQEDPLQKAQEVGDQLSEIAQLVSQMGSPSMKKNMDVCMKAYMAVVQEAVGGGADASQPEGQGQVPMQQGMGGVPMGPQTRQ